ncbi:hypothetical protein ACP70R_007392 [Stipagrostis hirtigluma subsp. patula]
MTASAEPAVAAPPVPLGDVLAGEAEEEVVLGKRAPVLARLPWQVLGATPYQGDEGDGSLPIELCRSQLAVRF